MEIGNNVSMIIKSSMKFQAINLFVVGRTGKNVYRKINTSSEEFELSFRAEEWMIPEVNVLVYFFHHTGEIVYDTVSVHFDENFSNRVSNIIDESKK